MVLPVVYNSVNMITCMIMGATPTVLTLLVIVTTTIMSTRTVVLSRKLMMVAYFRIVLQSVIPG